GRLRGLALLCQPVQSTSLREFTLTPVCTLVFVFFFSFNDPPTTEIYTLSLHDALPIFVVVRDKVHVRMCVEILYSLRGKRFVGLDRKSTRLNSSHLVISYAVFCLKKKTRPGSPRSVTDMRSS